MEPASLLLILALSAIVAILYSKINAYAVGTTWGTKIIGNGSFARTTALATGVIFVSIILASFILGVVDSKPKL
jgi:hypothetical protein